MKKVYAYPGTFCPPHRGHENVVKRMAQISGKVTVVCSENPDKNDRWFTPEECKEMWQACGLGDNITIMTLAEFMATHTQDERIVMVRGIRNEEDLAFEKKILEQNRRDYGIEDYHYIVADEMFKDFSSTKTRDLALEKNLADLEQIVHAKIAERMFEKGMEVRERII